MTKIIILESQNQFLPNFKRYSPSFSSFYSAEVRIDRSVIHTDCSTDNENVKKVKKKDFHEPNEKLRKKQTEKEREES